VIGGDNMKKPDIHHRIAPTPQFNRVQNKAALFAKTAQAIVAPQASMVKSVKQVAGGREKAVT
jgi:hypothetical protein